MAISHSSEPTTKIWMMLDPHYQRRRCSAMTVVSGNIRFMRIFEEVPWWRGVKRQCGYRKTSSQDLAVSIISGVMPLDPKSGDHLLHSHSTRNARALGVGMASPPNPKLPLHPCKLHISSRDPDHAYLGVILCINSLVLLRPKLCVKYELLSIVNGSRNK